MSTYFAYFTTRNPVSNHGTSLFKARLSQTWSGISGHPLLLTWVHLSPFLMHVGQGINLFSGTDTHSLPLDFIEGNGVGKSEVDPTASLYETYCSSSLPELIKDNIYLIQQILGREEFQHMYFHLNGKPDPWRIKEYITKYINVRRFNKTLCFTELAPFHKTA